MNKLTEQDLKPQKELVDGKFLLAFQIPETDTFLSKKNMLKSSKGWLIQNSGLEPWYFTNLFKDGTQLMIGGPYLKGELLWPTIEKRNSASVNAINRLATALLTLISAQHFDSKILLNGVYLLSNGGILIFPPEIIQYLNDNLLTNSKTNTSDYINHPNLKSSEQYSMAIGILIYRIITGNFPFDSTNLTELHDQLRSQKVVPPNLYIPTINNELCNLIITSLRPSKSQLRPTLQTWIQELKRISQNANLRFGNNFTNSNLIYKLEKNYKANLKLRVLIQKNLRLIFVSLFGILILGSLTFSIVTNITKPNANFGLAPREVVELFYSNLGTLNHTVLEESTIEGAAKGRINEVIHLFVSSRISEGYQGTSLILNVSDWIASGKPKLSDKTTVYGVSDLKIYMEKDVPTPVFRVHYLMWQPHSNVGTAVVERVFLKQKKNDWVIYDFSEINSE